jgi:hypothetical protein
MGGFISFRYNNIQLRIAILRLLMVVIILRNVFIIVDSILIRRFQLIQNPPKICLVQLISQREQFIAICRALSIKINHIQIPNSINWFLKIPVAEQEEQQRGEELSGHRRHLPSHQRQQGSEKGPGTDFRNHIGRNLHSIFLPKKCQTFCAILQKKQMCYFLFRDKTTLKLKI